MRIKKRVKKRFSRQEWDEQQSEKIARMRQIRHEKYVAELFEKLFWPEGRPSVSSTYECNGFKFDINLKTLNMIAIMECEGKVDNPFKHLS